MKILAILLILAFTAIISCTEADDDEEPRILFESTCTPDEEKLLEDMQVQDLAERVSDQANTTLGKMEQFKDEFAQMIQNQIDFGVLLRALRGKEWLRSFDWYRDEILPKKKEFGKPMPSAYLEIFHNKAPEILPKIQKAIKMLLGGLVAMNDHAFDDYNQKVIADIKKDIDHSIVAMKSLLCTYTYFLQFSDVEVMLSLTAKEVPVITDQTSGLLYRDTLNFLEYLRQVSHYVAEDTKKMLCEVRASIGLPCTPEEL